MRTWKRIVREYFTFNNRERRGLFALVFMLFVLISIHVVMRNMPQALPKLTFQDLETIDDFVETEKNLISTNDSDSNTKPEIRWVSFGPNVVSAQELIRLGLKDYVAERLVKYRTKGGRFGSMSDLSKIYGIDSEWIKKAEPYAQFEVKAQQTESANQFMISAPDSVAASIPKIELNQAESLELIQVPWIGPYYAREIVKLRADLGGFRDYLQLLEIYNMKDDAIESLIEHSTLDTALIVPIHLNSCDVRRLAYHPYLSWRQAKIIVNYRDQHGPYENISLIKETDVINDSVYLKIAPYLTVE